MSTQNHNATLQKGRFEVILPQNAPNPIVSLGTKLGEGNSGKVYKVRLTTSAATGKNFLGDDGSTEYAVKVLRDEPESAVEAHFVQNLSDYGIMSDHFVTNHAGYQRNSQFHIVSELADGSMIEMMGTTPNYTDAGVNKCWLMKQLRGLAKALKTLHGPTNGRVGLHHDIKPANVLWFKTHTLKRDSKTHKLKHDSKTPKTTSDSWTQSKYSSSTVKQEESYFLKLTDWGAASMRPAAGLVGAYSSVNQGSPTFSPPETYFERPLASAYDIWSLGCVFVELLVWYLGGPVALEELVSGIHVEHNYTRECWYVLKNKFRVKMPKGKGKPGSKEATETIAGNEEEAIMMETLMETLHETVSEIASGSSEKKPSKELEEESEEEYEEDPEEDPKEEPENKPEHEPTSRGALQAYRAEIVTKTLSELGQKFPSFHPLIEIMRRMLEPNERRRLTTDQLMGRLAALDDEVPKGDPKRKMAVT